MSLRRYPVGQQDFPSIRKENKIYVDKTMFALKLLNSSKYNFLSKPRRFGKSLFISTLESILLGKKDLFEGLYIYDKWDFVEYPIIRISFSNIGYRTMGLQKAIAGELKAIAKSYGLSIEHDSEDIANIFKELIQKLHAKHGREVAILIDEYDKPIIDYLDKENLHLALENRGMMKTFYSVLKDAETHLKFLFITGVSRFSKVSIFSDLNNLTDISMLSDFHEICGISQQELEDNFAPELEIYDKEEIKRWYNGYKWDVNGQSVYNPFSLLQFFFSGGQYQNFWYATGTPTFLMNMCIERHLYDFEEVTVNANELGNFDIENLKIIPILFQTGYLTVKSKGLLNSFVLGFPNTEVRESYLRNLADAYIDSTWMSSSIVLDELLKSLQTQNKEKLHESINKAFAHIPYGLWQKENEQYYHALVHLLFSLLGVYIFSEVQTQYGRTDTIVIFENQIYCMEFKLDKTAQEAIDQIKAKEYTERFKDSGKPIHHIGINFSSEHKKVQEVIWEVLE